jgi:hypothetical protein
MVISTLAIFDGYLIPLMDMNAPGVKEHKPLWRILFSPPAGVYYFYCQGCVGDKVRNLSFHLLADETHL